jgi:hypothetical protein
MPPQQHPAIVRRLVTLLRDVFGPRPFRDIAIDPNLLTSTVVSLARSMYESRNFSTMPLLADAFEDAECNHADILTHCRSDGPHVRGCGVFVQRGWVFVQVGVNVQSRSFVYGSSSTSSKSLTP